MSSMKAVLFRQYGGPDVLRTGEVQRPEPGARDVLVNIHAAGICYHDILSRAGRIPRDKPGQILGHEISGEIAEVGPEVDRGRIGQRVVIYQRVSCGVCRYCLAGRHDLCRESRVMGEVSGGYAEYTCVPVQNAIPVPDGVDLLDAALAVCPVGTSVRATLGVAQAKPGDVVLITGAGGGLGLHQIQVAKSVRAHVIAITSSEAKAESIRQAGADEVVVSPDLQFSREVWRLTQKQGVDIVLENVVTGTFSESLRSTAQNAMIVVLGNIGTRPVELDPGMVIVRRTRIAGSGNATFADVHRALHLMAVKAVKPVIGRVLPFSEAAQGNALVEGKSMLGRVGMNAW